MNHFSHSFFRQTVTACLISIPLVGLITHSSAQTVNLSTAESCDPDLGSVDLNINPHGLVSINEAPTSTHTPFVGAMPLELSTLVENIRPKLCKSLFSSGQYISQSAWINESGTPNVTISNGEFNSEYTVLSNIQVNTRTWLECTTLHQCFSFTNTSSYAAYQLSFMPTIEGSSSTPGLVSTSFETVSPPLLGNQKSLIWFPTSQANSISPSIELKSSAPHQFAQWEVNSVSNLENRFRSNRACPNLRNSLSYDQDFDLINEVPSAYLLVLNANQETLAPGAESPEYCYEITWDHRTVCSDEDDDGVCFGQDNCPTINNPAQESSASGLGVVCQDSSDDYDLDDIGEGDNCPLISNSDQSDLDDDGLGDLCDPDLDGDGINNDQDNCPNIVNPNQENGDSDELGDVCDDSTSLTFSSDPLLCDSELGTLMIDLDEFGAFGSGNGQNTNLYDPANDEPDQGGVRTIFQGFSFLCTENSNGTDGSWLSKRNLNNSGVQYTRIGNQLNSEFTAGHIRVNLQSELQCTTLKTCYTLTNISDSELSTVALTPYLDGDLYFGVGGLSNDFGGVSSSRPITLWQFDEGGQTSETPYVSMSAREHDELITSWEVGSFSEQRNRIAETSNGCTELRNDINRSGINSDLNQDLITDRGYDVTVAMRFDVGPLLPGESSVQFCVNTSWTEGTPCSDEDFDEVCFTDDNCPTIYNPNQEDFDGDGQGDFCEEPENPFDLDFDGITEGDNCPNTANADQRDVDQDGQGDVCDDDIDGDGIYNQSDSCPNVVNLDSDRDSDGIDDACDSNLDRDQDTIDDGLDNCIEIPNQSQEDLDEDGQGDACDMDLDGDGINNAQDLCPRSITPNQADLDGDGQGDYCDDDIDGDEVSNNNDACPFDDSIGLTIVSDADQDGIDDSCDGNIDGDSFVNEVDNCPNVSNDLQVDLDADGLGDDCDDDIDGDDLEENEGIDYCPYLAGSPSDNLDLDLDGLGNSCDDDDDGDTVFDGSDNCPLVSNPNQLDTDLDGIGDLCDSTPNDARADQDGDAVLDQNDNCPTITNPDQNDRDGDGLGDQCDPNIDGDQFDNQSDLCPLIVDNGQDQDRDSFGDSCDQDRDGDGLNNDNDNCPDRANFNQRDLDRDGIGDTCDSDRDGDFIQNEEDLCPDFNFAQTEDIDGDGLGDDCDPNINDAEPELSDEDNDGINFVSDNCSNTNNPEQRDLDQDGNGDACDDDIDGDGVINGEDNCPYLANADQVDLDEDLVGDYCEAEQGLDPQNPDSDDDGVIDGEDNCPLLANADQLDNDADGIGSACDEEDDSPEAGSEMTAGEMTAGEMTAGEITAGEITAGEMTAGEMTAGEITAGEMTAGEITLIDEENMSAGSENQDEEEILDGNRDIKPTSCQSAQQSPASLWWLMLVVGIIRIRTRIKMTKQKCSSPNAPLHFS